MFKLAPILWRNSPHAAHGMYGTFPPYPPHHFPQGYPLFITRSLDTSVPTWFLPVDREIPFEPKIEIIGVIARKAIVQRIGLDIE